jgi:uncharacterized membrane protein YfcA
MTAVILAIAILAIATLYSSVGHAGASGYLAAMVLVGLVGGATLAQEEMKAIALTLNIVVASIGAVQFARAGHFHWRTFWPLAAGAIPMAFVGGLWKLPGAVFGPLVGCALLIAAANLIVRVVRARRGAGAPARTPRMPAIWIAVPIGAALGLLAGVTGTGGGIFLSPLLILAGWASPKRTAAVSVVFVLVNSIAGLGGVLADSPALPRELPVYIACAVVGGAIGSTLGARRLPGDWIRILLAVVLVIAAGKLFLMAVG